jgi:gliding motility-associated-like protein
VGGELSLQYANKENLYRLTLLLYFDDINGEPDVEDSEIYLGVFSKRTNRQVSSFVISRAGTTQVNYTDPACTNSRLQTRQIRYSNEVILEPGRYNEIDGYYVSWERCCRNENIINIANPGNNGMVFYLEFPALIRNGTSFINSSPSFSIPKGDYACVNEPFVFDFNATDADGDELRYSLTTPYRGNSRLGNDPFGPGPHPGATGRYYPAPYAAVSWAAGFNLSNIIGGPQPLRIDTRGQLTFTANRLGLFVFSVLCEEYRNGVKLGAVQRDFQLLVIDCPKNDPPVVQARETNNSKFYQNEEVLELSYDGKLCFDVLVSDLNANTSVRIQANPLNFSSAGFTFSPTTGILRTANDTLKAQVCFTECIPHSLENPLLLQIIASDNGCPIPKRDTLLVKVYIAPKPSTTPEVITTLSGNTDTLIAGQNIRFDVIATDVDNELIKLYAVGRGFMLSDVGMQFKNSSGRGKITEPFSWTPTCENMQANSTYVIDFITEDNSCAATRFDTVTISLSLETFETVMRRFAPPNVFTPNNDGRNDYFEIPSLPADNCNFVFENIEIYNRWGRPVYTATIREFQWAGVGFPTGVYYYQISYGVTVYKGTVSLLR